MRKRSKQEIIKKEYEYQDVSVTCNKCGKEKSLTGDEYEKEWQSNEYQSFSCYFGYGSRYDMESWKFDLCEDCLTELIKTFKIVPDGFGETDYLVNNPQKLFDNWKETGKYVFEYDED